MDRDRRRHFGQNFLRNDAVIKAIVRDVPIAPDERVLEIGPGHGALTKELLATGARVTAVEVDPDCVSYLRIRKARGDLPGHLRIERSDFLKYDTDAYLDEEPDSKPWIVGNLPYNCATPILTSLLPRLPRVRGVMAMVQLEVAKRLCAEPGGKDFGYLSVLLQGVGKARILRRIEPANFKPVPKVMSATVLIEERENPLPAGRDFYAFATLCFAQKRKMLYNALEAAYDRNAVRAALAAIGADEKVRAEALSADRLFELYGILGLPSGVTLGGKATPRDGREGSSERTA